MRVAALYIPQPEGFLRLGFRKARVAGFRSHCQVPVLKRPLAYFGETPDEFSRLVFSALPLPAPFSCLPNPVADWLVSTRAIGLFRVRRLRRLAFLKV